MWTLNYGTFAAGHQPTAVETERLPSRTLLEDLLNPATHGDALVNVQRVGSAPAFGYQWAVYLWDAMHALTTNFAVIIRNEAQFDIHAEIQRLSKETSPGVA